MNGICLVLIVAFAAATADVEKRQLPTCTNAFTLTNNPCFVGNLVYYYAVPGDNTKFVQCDSSGGAYVVQCPSGRVYDAATTTCKAAAGVTATPFATPVPAGPVGPSTQCTAQAIATGQIYFAFPGDNTRYYKCSGLNQISAINCPRNLVWDQTRVSCVLTFGTITARPATTRPPVVVTAPPTLQNPCTIQQLAAKHYYFAHPDPTRFIQCDLTGQYYVLNCPQGLAWSQFLQVCSAPAQTGIIGK